jgi:hypothetical protein
MSICINSYNIHSGSFLNQMLLHFCQSILLKTHTQSLHMKVYGLLSVDMYVSKELKTEAEECSTKRS